MADDAESTDPKPDAAPCRRDVKEPPVGPKPPRVFAVPNRLKRIYIGAAICFAVAGCAALYFAVAVPGLKPKDYRAACIFAVLGPIALLTNLWVYSTFRNRFELDEDGITRVQPDGRRDTMRWNEISAIPEGRTYMRSIAVRSGSQGRTFYISTFVDQFQELEAILGARAVSLGPSLDEQLLNQFRCRLGPAVVILLFGAFMSATFAICYQFDFKWSPEFTPLYRNIASVVCGALSLGLCVFPLFLPRGYKIDTEGVVFQRAVGDRTYEWSMIFDAYIESIVRRELGATSVLRRRVVLQLSDQRLAFIEALETPCEVVIDAIRRMRPVAAKPENAGELPNFRGPVWAGHIAIGAAVIFVAASAFTLMAAKTVAGIIICGLVAVAVGGGVTVWFFTAPQSIIVYPTSLQVVSRRGKRLIPYSEISDLNVVLPAQVTLSLRSGKTITIGGFNAPPQVIDRTIRAAIAASSRAN